MPQKEHMLNASPRINGVFNHQSFGLWPFKMLDYTHLGLLSPGHYTEVWDLMAECYWFWFILEFTKPQKKKIKQHFSINHLYYDRNRKTAFFSLRFNCENDDRLGFKIIFSQVSSIMSSDICLLESLNLKIHCCLGYNYCCSTFSCKP